MPPIYTQKIVNTVTGLICDNCGLVDEKGFNDFHINYRFGYGTPLDTANVEFSLCDNCVIDLVTKNIPNARFTDSGKPIKVTKSDTGIIGVTY
jgi:hypothetical protein